MKHERMKTRAIIVAAGGANYGSLREACRRIGVEADLSDDPQRIAAATHVILPGVGAAAQAMRALRERGLDRTLAKLGQPLLGVCLGMQLLFEASDEGGVDGLGLIPGTVRRLPAAPSWPHMGWNTLPTRAPHALLEGLDADAWFYFVHGYAAPVDACTIAASEHGTPFAAAVARGNVLGAQFHPEKSAGAGRRLLANFFALA
jgi:glutamine amidotransferase